MTNQAPTTKTLSFHKQKFGLQDSEARFVSLADLSRSPLAEERAFWQNLPWQESEISEVDLGDLPCRLESASLALALRKIWQICKDDALVKVRLPHPRHDIFLRDLGYVRGLLPESFAQLDPLHSVTGLSTQLGVRFETVETLLLLDPHWQQALDEGKVNADDIQVISRQALNVIEWIEIQLQVKKSLWVQTDSPLLTPEMKKQLMDQLQACIDRGDEQAAALIRKIIASDPSGRGV